MPTDKVNARNDWIFGCIRNPLADKNLMVQQIMELEKYN